MVAAILVTKLYLPSPRPGMVPRPSLVARLNDGLAGGRKLALVSAPAGFGKTTLVSEWVAGCGRPVAWLSLDEGDSDPAGFLHYLVAALQTIADDIGAGTLAALQSPQPPATELILTTLLNDIAAMPHRFILVLDDYHRIDSEAIDHALAFLLDHLPPRMHLVIATREDPPLPLARLRARGQLTELRAADLRFTPVEAAEFLNRVMGLSLSDGDVAALETRTEGWIAGLQLAALSMQGHQDTAGFIQSFTASHRFVLDYLVEEVLQQQPESIQTFLLRTSILDRLCGPLCDAVLLNPSSSGQETLDHLEHANLFIVPLDSERRWYRYHHLFGDLLRQRLGTPPELPTYHRRASEWYEANNDLAGAFSHALAAGDFERAARLAEAAWPGMERGFQIDAWLDWVKKLPDGVVASRPGLCVMLGRALKDLGDVEESETWLRTAERALANATSEDEAGKLPATIALIRGDNAQIVGDQIGAVRYTELALQLAPEDDMFLRAHAAITLGFTHWSTGDLEASLRALYAWVENMEKMGNREFAIASAFAGADMLVILGRLSEAEKALRGAIESAAAQGSDAETVTAHHHLGLALIAHERGEDAAAARHLATAGDLGQRTTLIDWRHRWNLALARLKESAGEWAAALDLLDEAGRVYVKNPIPIQRPVEAMKTRIYLKQGRLDKAAAWARERGLSVTDEVAYPGEYEYLTLSRLRLAERDFTGVDHLLERLLAAAEAQKRTGSVIEILVTQALVHQAQGDQVLAFTALERALALAEPEGYRRIFVAEGEAMRRLLLKFKSDNEKQAAHPLRGYVDAIVAAFSPPAMISTQSASTNQGAVFIEPLTNRELEILRLIAEGLSNAEIGRRLYLALSTVKGHNLRIFSKLQAQNRTEAVARARELGFL
jgi:LuxR family transcriptional regulator, maltose regulon positive regulatory protein